jgi:hypothetical protein
MDFKHNTMIELKRIILTATLIVHISSCSLKNINIAGKYQWSDRIKLSSSELILNQDSTFRYSFQVGDMYSINSEGHWSILKLNKQLILNSTIQSENDIIKVDEIRNRELHPGTIRISVYDTDNNPYFAYIIADPESRDNIKFDNADYVNKTVVLKKTTIREIALNYMGIGSRILLYNIKDSMANDIKINVKISSSKNYRFFNNLEWQIGNKMLIDKDTVFNKNGERVYLKVAAFSGGR